LESCVDYSFEIKCEDRYGLRDTERSNFTTLCVELTPTPTPTPEPTLEPTIPPVEPTATPTEVPDEEIPLEEVSISWYAWYAIAGVVIILAGLSLWWWLKKRARRA